MKLRRRFPSFLAWRGLHHPPGHRRERRFVLDAPRGYHGYERDYSVGSDWSQIEGRLRAGENAIRYLPEWIASPSSQPSSLHRSMTFRFRSTGPGGKAAAWARVANGGACGRACARPGGTAHRSCASQRRHRSCMRSSVGSTPDIKDFAIMLLEGTSSGLNANSYIRMMRTRLLQTSASSSVSRAHRSDIERLYIGNQAIGFAFETIRSGRQTVMLAGAPRSFVRVRRLLSTCCSPRAGATKPPGKRRVPTIAIAMGWSSARGRDSRPRGSRSCSCTGCADTRGNRGFRDKFRRRACDKAGRRARCAWLWREIHSDGTRRDVCIAKRVFHHHAHRALFRLCHMHAVGIVAKPTISASIGAPRATA